MRGLRLSCARSEGASEQIEYPIASARSLSGCMQAILARFGEDYGPLLTCDVESPQRPNGPARRPETCNRGPATATSLRALRVEARYRPSSQRLSRRAVRCDVSTEVPGRGKQASHLRRRLYTRWGVSVQRLPERWHSSDCTVYLVGSTTSMAASV